MNQPNLPTTIRHKYIAHLRAITAFNDDQRITLDAVDFALACALADLNECWADEHASLQQRTTRLQNELISARELEQRLQAGLNQTMLENDILEAESNRLRQHYADSERNHEISRMLAHEARTVRSMIRTYLLPHLVTPHGCLAIAHLPDDHWSLSKRLLDIDGDPLDEPAISSNLIELAHEMFEHLTNQIAELFGQRDGLWQAYNELRTTTTASSQPTTAQTAPSAPAASTTSKPPAPTPPSPTASTTASADPAAPASSATTSPPKRGRPSTPKPPKTPKNPLPSAEAETEAGQTTAPNPIDWPAALAGLLTPEQITYLEIGTTRWRHIGEPLQTVLILRIAQTIHQHTGSISMSIFDLYRPAWATSVASWTKTTDLKWNDVLNHLRIVPQNRPISSRIVRSATTS